MSDLLLFQNAPFNSFPLGVTLGGTGSSTLGTAGSVLITQGTGAPTAVAPGATNAVLQSNGSGWTSQVFKTPTVQTFLSGSGSYVKPANVLYLNVQACGGGGGGGRNGATPAAGAGGNTIFGATLITCFGGAGAIDNTSGAGGGATFGAAGIGVALFGSYGGAGGVGSGAANPAGADGGKAPFFGIAGAGGEAGGTGPKLSPPNSGGGGGGNNAISGSFSGGGGGGGGGVNVLIPIAGATYAYTVGAGGASQGATLGTGAAGIIIVTEFYQ